MSVSYGSSSDKFAERASMRDGAEFVEVSVSSQWFYWSVLFASASISVLGFWKLIDLLT